MFEQFEPVAQDPILKLMGMLRDDPRPQKIDVGVGVFRDARGATPIMEAVREAEARLHDQQITKAYVGLTGDERFNSAIAHMIFGDFADMERVRAVQTPGGCGALRMLSDTLYRIASGKTFWVSDPTWGNHYPIFRQSGFHVDTYPYLDRRTRQVDFDALMGKLTVLGQDDIVVFHACCHNPSGAELSPGNWNEIARLAAKNGFFPYFDLAYQGFGDSLEADVHSVRAMAEQVGSMVVASSCSKNFGLYRDRVGCSLLVGETSRAAETACNHLTSNARSSYSMPPDHGAAIVSLILSDAGLKANWESELTSMRQRILTLRKQLSDILREKCQSARWDFIEHHRGMFSLLVLSDEEVARLRNDHAVYAVAGGRINIAGLQDEAQLRQFADALVAVTG